MNLSELNRAYQDRRPALEDLAQSARRHLQRRIQQRRIKIHSLQHRIKELDSLREKAKRQSAQDPLRDIHDLVGLRAVCLFRSDVPQILAIIRESFDVIEEEDKEDRNEKRTFDYMAVHVIAKMKPDNAGPRQTARLRIPLEIQVRTIGQDAWASVSHHLAYKQETSFPPDHSRDLYALSALFYLADTHFEFLKAACAQSLAGKRTEAP
ncbi:MAG: RelA/SpoT domain-containing protein [Phycisphaerae bacterium]|nr:RelA/SpoT domain-containing protein [Phycisphaerae bacterium]